MQKTLRGNNFKIPAVTELSFVSFASVFGLVMREVLIVCCMKNGDKGQ